MSNNFKAEKVSRTETITLNGKIETVFPLFGAFEERKWAEGWNPTLIYPEVEVIEEGTTFTTNAHGHDEQVYLWRVTRYDVKSYLIQYLVSTENRYWTITIKCASLHENSTSAEVVYTFIGLNDIGNKLNELSIQRMYKHNLKDWEDEINTYLATGKMKHYV